jgi:hypothetical protein
MKTKKAKTTTNGLKAVIGSPLRNYDADLGNLQVFNGRSGLSYQPGAKLRQRREFQEPHPNRHGRDQFRGRR